MASECATAGLICMEFWKGAFCTCPEGQDFVLNPDNGQIKSCSQPNARVYLGITSGALVAILVCLAALLSKPINLYLRLENTG